MATSACDLPEVLGKKICGAATDWLILVSESSPGMTLFNTLTRAQILLPAISKSGKLVVHKAVLSSSPGGNLGDGFLVMAIYGESRILAWYKSGMDNWFLLPETGTWYDDVVFHEGAFFAVDEYGKVVRCKFDSCFPTTKQIMERWFFFGHKVYIVGMDKNHLCLVVRYLKDKPGCGRETYHMKVFVFNKGNGEVVADMLEDWVVFLGHSRSIALRGSSNGGPKSNCVYFKDDFSDGVSSGNSDTRVFSCEDDGFQNLQFESANGGEDLWERALAL